MVSDPLLRRADDVLAACDRFVSAKKDGMIERLVVDSPDSYNKTYRYTSRYTYMWAFILNLQNGAWTVNVNNKGTL